MPRNPPYQIHALILSAVDTALGSHASMDKRRRVAHVLRTIATKLEQPRMSQHGGKGPPGRGVRRNGRDLLIGRALWQAIGEPMHITIDVAGTTTRITADGERAYKVRGVPRLVPRVACRRLAHHAMWAEGWRPETVEGGAIVFDLEATKP